jgi:hypothetical protein
MCICALLTFQTNVTIKSCTWSQGIDIAFLEPVGADSYTFGLTLLDALLVTKNVRKTHVLKKCAPSRLSFCPQNKGASNFNPQD